MDPDAGSDDPPERASNALSNFVGTVIAFLTLAIPIYAIAAYSSGSVQQLQIITPATTDRN